MQCTYEGCKKQALKRSLCEAHYCKLRRSGQLPMKAIAQKGAPEAFLREHVAFDGKDCLAWPFFRDDQGRGHAQVNGRRMWAPRVMCILAHGEPPFANAHAAHNCGKGHEGCVNPKHLYWATSRENNRDRNAHGTMPKGERAGTSKLSNDQVLAIHADRRSAKLIAKEFGVHISCVEAIRYGKTWAWLTGGRVSWVAPGYESRSRHANGWAAGHPRS